MKNGNRMGIKLLVETMERAPADLSSAERLLLVVLAEQAPEETRECWPGLELIQRRSGLGADAIRKAFQRLAGRGLEVRVPVGSDRNGRPVYAFEGQRTRYRIPRFAALSGGTEVPPQSREDIPATDRQEPGTDSHHSALEAVILSQRGGNPVPERREGLPALSLISPQVPSSLSLPIGFIRAAGVVAESEERDLAEWIIKTRDPASNAWWRKVAANGDFPTLADAWRATRTPQRTSRGRCEFHLLPLPCISCDADAKAIDTDQEGP